jgi:hypothetical protein
VNHTLFTRCYQAGLRTPPVSFQMIGPSLLCPTSISKACTTIPLLGYRCSLLPQFPLLHPADVGIQLLPVALTDFGLLSNAEKVSGRLMASFGFLCIIGICFQVIGLNSYLVSVYFSVSLIIWRLLFPNTFLSPNVPAITILMLPPRVLTFLDRPTLCRRLLLILWIWSQLLYVSRCAPSF